MVNGHTLLAKLLSVLSEVCPSVVLEVCPSVVTAECLTCPITTAYTAGYSVLHGFL
jgi:hypothetical protein